MSFIDTFKHEMCGQIAGLPLNHPQEPIAGEFTADETNLVLGGGSGEFPAAVIDVPRAVADFVDEYADRFLQWLEADDAAGPDIRLEYGQQLGLTEDSLAQLAASLRGVDVLYGHAGPAIHAPDWGSMEWEYVSKEARKGRLGAPFRPAKHHRVELWLSASVGEYVAVCFRDLLVDVDLSTEDSKTLSSVADLAAHCPLMGNVWQLPIGYLHGGRGTQLNDPNVRH